MSYVVEHAEMIPRHRTVRRLLLIVNASSLILSLPLGMFIAFWILIEPLVSVLSLTFLAYVLAVINSFIIMTNGKSLSLRFLGVAVILNTMSSIVHFLYWQ